MDKCSFIEHFSFTPYFIRHIHTCVEHTSKDLFWREFTEMPLSSGCLQPQNVLLFLTGFLSFSCLFCIYHKW